MSNTKPLSTEISINEIFKTLIDSKLAIIVIVSISTFFGFLYNTQKDEYYETNVFIETFNFSQNSQKEMDELVKDLKVELFYKQKRNEEDLQIDTILKDRLLGIWYKSTKNSFDPNLMTNILDFVKDWNTNFLSTKINPLQARVQVVNNEIKFIKNSLLNANELKTSEISNAINIKRDEIEFIKNSLSVDNELKMLKVSNKIQNLKNQIAFLKKNLFEDNEVEKVKISNQIKNIETEILSLNEKIRLLTKIIKDDERNLELLKSEPVLLLQRNSQSPSLEQVIYSYKSEVSNHTSEINLLLIQKDYLNTELTRLSSNESNPKEIELFNLNQEKNKLIKELKGLQNKDFSLTQLSKPLQEKDDLNKILDILGNKGIDSEELFLLNQEKSILEKQLFNLKNQDFDLAELSKPFQEKDDLNKILDILNDKGFDTEELFRLIQEKNQLELDIESLTKRKQNEPKLINELTISEVDPRNLLFLLFSATLGLLFSIVFVFLKPNSK